MVQQYQNYCGQSIALKRMNFDPYLFIENYVYNILLGKKSKLQNTVYSMTQYDYLYKQGICG